MIRKVIRIILKLILWFFISTIAVVLIYRFLPPPVTPLMILRVFEQAADEKRDVRLTKDWVSLEEMSKSMPLAVITSEDQKFEEHYGFDLEAIEKAQQYNERHRGKKVKGASTISQQTAKNVFLWPNRSYIRKGFEVYFTSLIELLWSKRRIMEVYLNVIEMGDGIYGAEAASREYFGKPASKLNNAEAALIAACLPNPVRWSPAKPSPYIKRKQSWILRKMRMVDRPDFYE
jgi:monofunctional biosynthetic peptidoglycan transglycosylase